VVTRSLRAWLSLVLCALILLLDVPARADPPDAVDRPALVGGERPSPHYSSVLYADIAPTLTDLAQSSPRIRVEQLGRSAGGLPLLLATVSSPENLARLMDVQARRMEMIERGANAPDDADAPCGMPTIVLLNAGWQGNAYAGVDAALALIQRLAEDESAETQRTLQNVILLVNVVPNPDGRVSGSPGNATDIEPARDLVAQSQPETRVVVDLLKAWGPMVVLDVDGFGSPMEIGVAAPPRQVPSIDLFTAWSLDIAHAMSTAVHSVSGYAPEVVALDQAAVSRGWPPLGLADYAAYHGGYGLSLTVASRDEGGVTALQGAINGALVFIAEHRAALIRDQARLLSEGLLRGTPVAPHPAASMGSLALNTLSGHAGPAAYLIPSDEEHQQDRHEAAALVNHLIANGVRVERTRAELTVDWKPHALGAYLVRLDQPRGALAAALLWAPRRGSGSDERAASGWSLPLAWGVTCLPLDRVPDIATECVLEAHPPRARVEPGAAAGYAYTASSNAAIVATNALLAQDVPLYWAPTAFDACQRHHPAGTIVLPADAADATNAMPLLSRQYSIDLEAVCALPAHLVRLGRPHIAAHADPGLLVVLRDLGFDVSALTTERLDAGHELGSYDLLIVSGHTELWGRLSARGKRSLSTYARDGGQIIGIGAAGADVAVGAGLADVDATITSHHFAAMAAISCEPNDPLTASYPEHTVLFARAPVWFTHLPDDAVTVAHLSPAGPLLTGYWPVWEDINPAGQPVIVHLPQPEGGVTLFGIDPTYGAFNRHGFRLLAQAIYRAGSPARQAH